MLSFDSYFSTQVLCYDQDKYPPIKSFGMIKLFIRSALLLIFVSLSLGIEPSSINAQENPEPPFRLPFQDPPGPETWLLGQVYMEKQLYQDMGVLNHVT